MDEHTRMDHFPYGFTKQDLTTIDRQIPEDEPSPLPPNSELRLIGKNIPRWDAERKVRGQTRYTVDIALPDMLHAAILRSPFPHAHIHALDLSKASALPGVKAVIQVIQPASSENVLTARYVGQPIAAVAAETPEQAQKALELIQLQYEPQTFTTSLQDAMGENAPIVWQDNEHNAVASAGLPAHADDLPFTGNIRGPETRGSRGEIGEGFENADIILENQFDTQAQTHCCMEPHSIVANWNKNSLDVWMSTQFTAGVRAQLAREFNLPLSKVRVRVEALGGGFGSKSQIYTYGKTAVELARIAGAPVQLIYSRAEEQMDSGNRPSSSQRIKIAARKDGTLTAVEIESYGSAGIAFGAGVGNIATHLYQCPNVSSKQYDVFMNSGPSTAMRGPGNAQGAFAMEQAIDELAEALKIDPIELRNRIDPSPIRREERQQGADKIGWASRHLPGADHGPIKRGMGMAQSLWGSHVQLNAACELRLWRDGRIEFLSSVQDIGTGAGTVIIQVIAEELGLSPKDIHLRIGDTDYPSGPPSYGSRTTASITPPARTAAHHLKAKLIQTVAGRWNVDSSELEFSNGSIRMIKKPSQQASWQEISAMLTTDQIAVFANRKDDYAGFSNRMGDAATALTDLGGVQFAEVAVDTETGIIRVERVIGVHDCGRPIHPLQIESQIHGGILMGISYALMEDRILDKNTGWMLNPNLVDYKIVGAQDIPDIEVCILENYQGFSATDAYGIAEPANIATAAAIANAVYNAIGIRMHAIPMTPAYVLNSLKNNGSHLGNG